MTQREEVIRQPMKRYRLTIARDRITLKVPYDTPDEVVDDILRHARIVNAEVQPVTITLRARFKPTDRRVWLCAYHGHPNNRRKEKVKQVRIRGEA